MEFGRILPAEKPLVLSLLERCGLPTADVDSDLLTYFVGARDEGKLVGVIGVQPFGHVGLLRSLAVDPTERGRGIGGRLCDEAESLAHAGDIAELYLLTNEAAEFFLKHGFEIWPRDQLPAPVQGCAQFRSLCPASATAMRKRVPSPTEGASFKSSP
ncbi:MAG TPA: arsenic resistance N-acetyltransferase ArsN2 [Burkholderiales bacterium]|nr:arsenic resistance N-acetyltransferase ArsN2 [Burkholderiales bacterium]